MRRVYLAAIAVISISVVSCISESDVLTAWEQEKNADYNCLYNSVYVSFPGIAMPTHITYSDYEQVSVYDSSTYGGFLLKSNLLVLPATSCNANISDGIIPM